MASDDITQQSQVLVKTVNEFIGTYTPKGSAFNQGARVFALPIMLPDFKAIRILDIRPVTGIDDNRDTVMGNYELCAEPRTIINR